ncbi:MAG: CopG family transcriptional regulator [Algibacter sp.]|uniref:ribbon-helix-helix domain-containing protein n=1 Tax=Algibacter sp. TaxID=1872428 RepID=UPI00262E398B|nr:CopG family transcriptional regulator [Algibacter sp.]MDG1728294.1 CopG family transcriptional regulator [Algibacter sp.]MDG2178252.1 CopG family transcriptional regulator [Algibacter sp.]
MARQSITLAKQNDEWLKNQVAEQEFSSKSEAVNYLIKQARNQEKYYDFVRMKIEKGENSGFVKKQSREDMLVEFKQDLPNV